jgi:serpin B
MRPFQLVILATLPTLLPAQGRTPAPEPALAAAEAGQAFAWDLHRALVKGDSNLFFSPYSVSACLAMVRAGASGKTAAQMDRVLRTTGLDAAAQLTLAKALVPRKVREGWGKTTTQVSAYELNIANAMWGQAGFTFQDDFLSILDKTFGAPLQLVDFRQSAEVRTLINSWVESRTNRKIKDIVPEGLPTPDTRLALGNAIYFKAAWAKEFSKRATRPETFTTMSGKKMHTPLMHRVGHYAYAAIGDLQVVEVPYRGGDVSMIVVLPKAHDALPALEAKIDAKAVAGWRGALRSARVRLKLPRFKFTCATDLATVLPAMGMKDAFHPKRANFTGMTTQEPLFVGTVLHKAAATVAMMKLCSASRPAEPVSFIADHPFLFIIQHRKTGCVLFAGRVTTPEEVALPKSKRSAKGSD